MNEVAAKDVYYSLRRHRMRNIHEEQTSSKYLNAKKLIQFDNDRKNYQLNPIIEGDE